MLWRGVALVLLAAVLSGCASGRTGTDYFAMAQKIGSPKSGQSRIVVLSEKAMGLSAAVCDVAIDGGAVGTLKAGTYVYADRPAGRHELVATQTLFPGDTKQQVSTESGRTYFFLVRNSERANAMTGMTLVGGLAGALVTAAVTSGKENPGPVDFISLDETTARTTLAYLQLAE